MFAAGLPCGYGRIDTETFTATLSELKQGREDSIRAICPPTGGLLPPALAEFTNGLFGKFFNDLLEDMPARAVANPHALNFKLSKAAATFMEVLEANYKTAFQVHEQLIFGSFVDTTTLSVATAISKTMQVDA